MNLLYSSCCLPTGAKMGLPNYNSDPGALYEHNNAVLPDLPEAVHHMKNAIILTE